jgi:hypothetical protein
MRISWTRNNIAMLGTMPDAALAEKLRVATHTVLKKRQKPGVPSR